MIVKLTTGDLKTKYGTFQEALYYDGQKESIAFYLGELDGAEDVLCRVHSSCIFGHYFNSTECDCQEQLDISQQLIQQAGKGIIILLDQEGKGNGHFALLNSVKFKREGTGQADAYEAAGFKKDNRDFSAAGKILNHLGVKSVRMLTNNQQKMATLENLGIEVTGTRATNLLPTQPSMIKPFSAGLATVAALKQLYLRDLEVLKNEILAYRNEANLWKTADGINNPGGNLCLHLIGNLKTYIGNGLAGGNYIRKRDLEFSAKNVPREALLREIAEATQLVSTGLNQLTEAQLNDNFPVLIWEEPTEMIFTLIHLQGHLQFHLGQLNYHRRIIEA